MAKIKITRPKAASRASKTIRSKSASSKAKSSAGSALSQTKAPKKVTSKKAASAASKTLRSSTASRSAKSAAGSALSQRQVKPPAKKGRVPSSTIRKAVYKVSKTRGR